MGRRGKGEGSIYQTADGRWRGYVDLGYVNGKRRRKYATAPTRKAVAAQLRAMADERDDGTLQIGNATLKFGDWLVTWVDTIAAAKVRPSTLATYRGYVANRIVPALGHHRLDALQPEHLEAFYRASQGNGLSSATILQMHRIISRALKVAHRRGKVRRNVATLVDAPSIQRADVEPLSAQEARRVLLAATTERNAARWSVALALGLRQGEALGLRWNDIDLDLGTLTVRHALQRVRGGGLTIVPPKSRAGRRSIRLPGPLRNQLREHRARQNEERLRAGSLWHDNDFVFATATGKPIDPRNDHRAWQQLLRAANVRPARLHDARHTAATLLLTQGVAPRVAMDVLGHSQITLTLGTYSHIVPELAEAAAAAMTAALWPSDNPDDAIHETPPEIGCQNGCQPAEPDPNDTDVNALTSQNAVGRPGIEPGTRGLKVRCSAS